MSTPTVCPACGTSQADLLKYEDLNQKMEFYRREGGVKAPAELRQQYDQALQKNRRRNECTSPLHTPPVESADVPVADPVSDPVKPAKSKRGKDKPAPAPPSDKKPDEVHLQGKRNVSVLPGEKGKVPDPIPPVQGKAKEVFDQEDLKGGGVQPHQPAQAREPASKVQSPGGPPQK